MNDPMRTAYFQALAKLLNTGEQMRDAQKRYFAHHMPNALRQAKRLEKEFDQLVRQISSELLEDARR